MSAKTEDIIGGFIDAMKGTEKPAPYDTTATVRRIEDGVAWVHIPGGVDETPVTLTIAAAVGDSVQVRVANGRAFLVGNATAPPTDDTTALVARTLAKDASQTAETAQQNAREAKASAGAAYKIAADTNQYFWHTETGTDTGAHITEVTREEFLADPTNGGGNLLARSNGIAVRDGLTELATMSAASVQIGVSNGGHTTIATNGMKVYGSNGFVELANIGYGSGTSISGTTADAPYFSFGKRESGSTVGNYSVAEGDETIASGYASHAEGYDTEASGTSAHAEGYRTYAIGFASHTEGYSTHADGAESLAAGYGTRAAKQAQTVIGTFNIEDTATTTTHPSGTASYGTYAVIVGNGTWSGTSASNALTIDWGGNVRLALDTTAATGTEDGDLYAAITALGWDSEVIA